jgi:hypothetical protein
MRGAVLVAIAVLACGCKRDEDRKPEPAPTSPPTPLPDKLRLFTEAEITELETALMKRLDENAKRTCPRPVLHGTPVPGPATPDMIALAEPTRELYACNSRITGLRAMASGDPDKAEAEQAAYDVIAKDCGSTYEKAIAAIVSHEDACSPYQPGRKIDPTFVSMLGGAKLIGAYARLRAERDPVGAMWLLVDALRAYQDFTRGHVTLVTSMTCAAAYKMLVDPALAILHSRALSQKDAEALAAAVDALFASEPPFGDTLLGERDHMGLYIGLARLRPKDWIPPGGTNDELRELSESSMHAGSRLDPRDEAALMLAMPERTGVHARACLARNLKRCWQELVSLAKRAGSATGAMDNPAALFEELLAQHGSKDTPEVREKVRLQVQDLVVTTLAATVSASYKDYVGRKARAITALVALRYALAFERDGRCPPKRGLGGLHESTWAAAGMSLLGAPVRLTAQDDAIAVTPPEGLDSGNGKDVTIGCP